MARKLHYHEPILTCKKVITELKDDAHRIRDTFPYEQQGDAWHQTFWHLYDAYTDMRELYESELRKLGCKIPVENDNA
jgi:hypothetical protein